MRYDDDKKIEFSDLVGKTLTAVNVGDDTIDFVCDSGESYQSYHERNCCERVWVDDVAGDIADIICSPILVADETSRMLDEDYPNPADCVGLTKWTSYKIDTVKGGVTIRWCGTSNGYYSVSVDFRQI